MPRSWRFSPHDEALVRGLSGRLGVSALVAQVLIARGYASADDASAFLNPKLADLHDPELLPGVADAADRVTAAVRDGRRITIYGDYDADGVTSTSLLWHCLKLAGANVDYYIPHRLEEGYGLNADAIRQLHEEDAARLLVTVDCGIAGVEDVALCRELGLEVIITDHHEFGDELPAADCVVHPRLPGSEYPFGGLCGVGVAFKLAWAVCKRLGDGQRASARMRDFLLGAVALTAIGTVADVVPLTGENRVLVRFGLGSLVERAGPGLRALMQVAGLMEKPQLQAEDLAFALAPRLNAAGRLGQARLAVELLTTDNAERAVALADYLNQLNNSRKTVERKMFKQARELVREHPAWKGSPALVLAHADWHAGVAGIVASRVAEHFEKPAVLVALSQDGQPSPGSGRSFAGYDLHAALRACAECLETYGGHREAAGLRVRADRLDEFREQFAACIGNQPPPADGEADLRIDAEVRLADVSHQAVRELERLGPFGQDNPRPVFASTRVDLAAPPKKMGEGDRHLSLQLRQYGTTLRAVAFGRGEWAERIAAAGGPIAVSFEPTINNFRGQQRVELHLKDWQEIDC